MSAPLTVSLNCAGSGSRLGLGQTKALVDIMGRPLIHWQLDLLDDIADLRVVVGFNAPAVIEAVLCRRPDALFVLNHDYARTATGDSLLLAADRAQDRIFSLDGDLLILPSDMRRLLAAEGNLIGVTPVVTDVPIGVMLNEAHEHLAECFVQGGASQWEWSGAAICSRDALLEAGRNLSAPRHVFHLLEPLLPLPAIRIEAREIDTPDDYVRAIAWMEELVHKEKWAAQTIRSR